MHGRLEIPNLSSSVEKYFTRTFERRERDEKFRISIAMSYPLAIYSHYENLVARDNTRALS